MIEQSIQQTTLQPSKEADSLSEQSRAAAAAAAAAATLVP